jgi:cellulose synthase/poly-beta-1,6-N-acetylglucosamine synthase-like glycosyltransferase
MIRTIAHAVQIGVLGLVAYNAAIAAWGWRQPHRAPIGARRRRFRVLIPAHNESAVIDGVLTDLADQDYPPDQVSIWVIADRCTDGTAQLAANRAQVDERTTGPDGKGAALAWHMTRHPLQPDEAVVVLDADNRVPADLLARMADELDAGHKVLQAYLDVVNPAGSVIATAGALTYWAGNRMVQLARSNLGWSCDLGGTGSCFIPEALERAGGFGAALVEDQELAVRLALAGVPVTWLHDVRVRDEKPEQAAVVARQRARWMAGKRAVARRYTGRLLTGALRTRRWELFDQALRLVQPGRSFVALLTGLVGVAAAATGSIWLLSWPVWAVAAGVQVLMPLPFLARDGVETRYLVRYPLVVLIAALWAPVRVMSRRIGSAWYHTPHGEDQRRS